MCCCGGYSRLLSQRSRVSNTQHICAGSPRTSCRPAALIRPALGPHRTAQLALCCVMRRGSAGAVMACGWNTLPARHSSDSLSPVLHALAAKKAALIEQRGEGRQWVYTHCVHTPHVSPLMSPHVSTPHVGAAVAGSSVSLVRPSRPCSWNGVGAQLQGVVKEGRMAGRQLSAGQKSAVCNC